MHEEKSATIGEKVEKGREISFKSLESGEIEMSGMSGKPRESIVEELAIKNTLSLSLKSQAEVVAEGSKDELEKAKIRDTVQKTRSDAQWCVTTSNIGRKCAVATFFCYGSSALARAMAVFNAAVSSASSLTSLA